MSLINKSSLFGLFYKFGVLHCMIAPLIFVALHVKCSKVKFYISSGGPFQQLWLGVGDISARLIQFCTFLTQICKWLISIMLGLSVIAFVSKPLFFQPPKKVMQRFFLGCTGPYYGPTNTNHTKKYQKTTFGALFRPPFQNALQCTTVQCNVL